jgi:hypothetical protein
MMRIAWMGTFLVGITFLPLQGQTTPKDQARAALPQTLFQSVETLAVDAAGRGVPEGPLFNKALEGMAKGVPEPLLLDALQGYSQRLGMTRAAFGSEATTSLLVAGANALQRGVDRESLRSLGAARGRSPMAVMVFADLIETGVTSEGALRVVHEAMGKGMGEDMMLHIPEQVHRFMRQGHSPAMAADRVWSHIRGGMGWGSMFMGQSGWMGPGVTPGWTPMGWEGHSGWGR